VVNVRKVAKLNLSIFVVDVRKVANVNVEIFVVDLRKVTKFNAANLQMDVCKVTKFNLAIFAERASKLLLCFVFVRYARNKLPSSCLALC
jgi:hypothetical protein